MFQLFLAFETCTKSIYWQKRQIDLPPENIGKRTCLLNKPWRVTFLLPKHAIQYKLIEFLNGKNHTIFKRFNRVCNVMLNAVLVYKNNFLILVRLGQAIVSAFYEVVYNPYKIVLRVTSMIHITWLFSPIILMAV